MHICPYNNAYVEPTYQITAYPLFFSLQFSLFAATPTYAVAFGVDGENGTVKAKADGGTETAVSLISVEKDKTVTFTATTNSGYKVKEWKVDGAVAGRWCP